MPPRTRVKERAEEQVSTMSADQQATIRMLANDLHRLNQSVMKAVEAGVSVELVRSARHHGSPPAEDGYKSTAPALAAGGGDWNRSVHGPSQGRAGACGFALT